MACDPEEVKVCVNKKNILLNPHWLVDRLARPQRPSCFRAPAAHHPPTHAACLDHARPLTENSTGVLVEEALEEYEEERRMRRGEMRRDVRRLEPQDAHRSAAVPAAPASLWATALSYAHRSAAVPAASASLVATAVSFVGLLLC